MRNSPHCDCESLSGKAHRTDCKLANEECHVAPTGSYYYPLFEHMAYNHDLTLLDSEMADICHVVRGLGINRIHPSAANISDFLRPCVYALFNKRKVLYIGKGKTILRVAQSAQERHLSLASAQIIPCDSMEQAEKLERELIEKFDPPMNAMIPKSQTEPARFKPGRHPHHRK